MLDPDLDLVPRTTFTLTVDMSTEQPRERLLIGEVARLLGITPKAVRHYEKLRLLDKPERSESGYRLYTADELLRLHQIKKLQSLGLSLERIKGVLGEDNPGVKLGSVLEALLGEVERQIGDLERRRSQLQDLLAENDFAKEDEVPYALELARRHLGERWSNVAPELLEQVKKLWSTLDSFQWPQGYEKFQEAIVLYVANHPAEYEELLALEERLAALAHLPEDSPEVEQLAEDYAAYFEKSLFLEEVSKQTAWGETPMGNMLSGIVLSTMAPAQERCMELLQERIPKGTKGEAER